MVYGKHCGGYPVLGYDSDPITKKLHINEAEAETVRFVFTEYLRTGSAKAVLEKVGELLQSTTLIAQMTKVDNFMASPKLRAVLKNIHGIWDVMCHYE